MMNKYTGYEIAVIGMTGRFPGASNTTEFWDNLKNSVESIRFFTDEELLEEGIEKTLLEDPNYIKANSYIEDKEYFDSSFFNYLPDEARLMDPQMRIMHECVWEAIESAGYNPGNFKGRIGLFTGASSNLNWECYAVLQNTKNKIVDSFSASILADKNYSNTRISYLLNLRGPSVTINTACSTSLVSIHQACNSLLLGECSIAIAGGITISNYSKKGYLYEEGTIASADGHCRAFDAEACGTIGGEGVGLVVLKRLNKALEDKDNILAVIKGTGLNNDGSDKVGFTAPGVNGQLETIMMARKMAKVEPQSISYIETHGTGTKLGDPIEIEALQRAFGKSSKKYCAIGSVKTNIGHLDSAAGVASFIKTVLALKNKQIPPSLNFKTINPKINLNNSPFYVNTSLKEWKNNKYPLRAGVSSFGIGGTNAHIILEEAPKQQDFSPSRSCQLLLYSAKTYTALKRYDKRLLDYFKTNSDSNLSDIAYTLKTGRMPFAYRKMLVCKDMDEAVSNLSNDMVSNEMIPTKERNIDSLVFMFSGQGSQYVNMCNDLYQEEVEFKKEVDKCFDIIKKLSGKELRTIIFPETNNNEQIHETEYTQPLLFTIEYALARLLMKWGINPDILIGHSIGEYVAACLSGVFSLKDALFLVIKRGELMQKMSMGSMLSVSITENELELLLSDHKDISLAGVNSTELCIVSGPNESIQFFKEKLDRKGYRSRIIRTSHAFHSSMMDQLIPEFERELNKVTFNSIQKPFISNFTGKLATDKEISTALYWTNHLRYTVKFSKGIETQLSKKNVVFVEVGPGNALSTFVAANKLKKETHKVFNLVRHPQGQDNDMQYLLTGLGNLWINGIEPDWESFYSNETRRRVSLPTYSFDKIKYPIEVDAFKMISTSVYTNQLTKIKDISEWFYVPTWKISTYIPKSANLNKKTKSVIFVDNCGVSAALTDKFKKHNVEVVLIYAGKNFKKEHSRAYYLNPEIEGDFHRLFQDLSKNNLLPDRIIHCWGIREETKGKQSKSGSAGLNEYFFSLFSIFKAAQYCGGISNKQIVVLTNNLHSVINKTDFTPDKALTLGILKVISQEYPSVISSHVDISLQEVFNEENIAKVFYEINDVQSGKIISYRNNQRWEQVYDRIRSDSYRNSKLLRNNGVYLITGGVGNLAFCLAKYLIEKYAANVILLGQTKMPQEKDWNLYIKEANKSGTVKLEKKIRRLKELKELKTTNGSVLYLACNVANINELKYAVEASERKFGLINGVIHAAGITEGPSIGEIRNLKKENFQEQFEPKIEGLQRLKEVMQGKNLDFCLITSSIASIIGGVGLAAYSSANIFMDYYILSSRLNGELENWTSVNFDGINFNDEKTEEIASYEFPSVFEKALALKEYPLQIVSTLDLSDRLLSWTKRTDIEDDTDFIEEILVNDNVKQSENNSEVNTNNSTEITLTKLWQHFFNNAEINAEDDFFKVGGDSLKALTMISRIHKLFNVEIPITDFFKQSSIVLLASYIDDIKNKNDLLKDEFFIIPKTPVKKHYQLSSAQKRLYFLHEFQKTSLAYNLYHCFKIEGKLNRENLHQAFTKLINRHESLRTSFVIYNEEVYQSVSEQFEFEIEYFRLNKEDIHDLINKFISPFDLECSPLIRVGLIEISKQVHILIIDMHHIVTDGVSHSLLLKDFMDLFNGAKLNDLKIQYKDYAEWQKTDEQQLRINNQKKFWINEFKDPPNTLELPIDFPRPELKSNAGASLIFEINEDETKKIKSIVDQEGSTLFMVLISFFYILLNKISNQEDIIIATPVANRQHADLEKVIGMFVNTLPLRNFPKADLSYQDFLSLVKKNTLECFSNQSFPYEELIDELKYPRDASRNPLFDVMFVFQNYEESEFALPGLTIKNFSTEHKISKFDITLTAIEAEKNITLNFEYCTKLFKQETIERFIAYYKRIVSGVIQNIGTKISNINILSENENRVLLKEFNNTKAIYPKDKSVIDLFEEQVSKSPEKTALIYDDSKLTYLDLKKLSDRIASFLIDFGVEEGDLVGLMLEREEYLVPLIFGLLKAGAVYVPLDPTYPEEKLNSITNDARLKVLISRGKYINDSITNSQLVIDFDAIQDKIGTYESKPYKINKKNRNLAYVIYTSGSTGQPKGVMIEHHSIVNRILWMQKEYSIDSTDVLLQKTPLVFDVSIWELFWWSITGASLCILKPNEEKEPKLIAEAIEKNKVTNIHFVPSMLSAFLDYVLSDFNYKKLSSLNHVFSSGEALKVELVNLFGKTIHKYCNSKLVNLYGPTEATVDVSFFNCTFDNINTIIPIGKPIDNIKLYVLINNSRQLAPIGVLGELCIAGVGLAKGYLGNEKLTNEKFIRNSCIKNETVYKTGDLARWLPDGNIEYLGRIDNQVKIRGFRIELGEIERHLSDYELVKESVVIIKEKNGEKYLVAYYVSNEKIEIEELKKYLSRKLSDYMIPNYFVHVINLPLTHNGKLDRKALPDPEIMRPKEFAKPVNQMQKELLSIWARVLDITEDKIGVNTNFFDAGGNSILLMKIVNQINRKLNIDISVAKAFKYPMISLLAEFIEKEKETDSCKDDTSNDDDLKQMNNTLELVKSKMG